MLWLPVGRTGRRGEYASRVATAVEALDDFDVSYETTAMGTIVEADDSAELFAAVGAANAAVDADRVETFLVIDDERTVDEPGDAKIAAVEEGLGRPARGDRG